MRHVQKGGEPRTLDETRRASTTNLGDAAAARAAFDQIDKAAARESLAREQGWLCAFCMRRIRHVERVPTDTTTTRIAHRTPIDVDPSLALTWKNLLGSCDGGERSQGRYRTCDVAQGSRPLHIDPTERASVARISYERDPIGGLRVTSADTHIRADLDALGLNVPDLRAARDAARKAFQRLAKERGHLGKPGWREFFPRWKEEHSDARRGQGAMIGLPEWLGVVEALL